MTGDDKAKLVEALRSGKYRQVLYPSDADDEGLTASNLAEHLGLKVTLFERVQLDMMNGHEMLSFAEIADLIENPDRPMHVLTPLEPSPMVVSALELVSMCLDPNYSSLYPLLAPPSESPPKSAGSCCSAE